MQPVNEPQELTSWKEIANYLDVTIRTAQTWERDRGLPVRRLPGVRGRVSISIAEIEKWRRATDNVQPVSPRSHHWWTLGGAALILLALSVALMASRFSQPRLYSAHLVDSSLAVFDADGKELWRKPIQYVKGVDDGWLHAGRFWIGDLDHDGRSELLVVVQQSGEGSELHCYSAKGDLRWRFVPGRKISTRVEEFSPHFVVQSIDVLPDGRVVVNSGHSPWFPAQIALLASDGRLLREYWHSGHFRSVRAADLDHDGKPELYAFGVSNAYKLATIVELDPETMNGASVEENPDYQFQGFAPGTEVHRILLPRSCISRAVADYNIADVYQMHADSMEAWVDETIYSVDVSKCTKMFEFGPGLRLIKASWSDGLTPLHRELRRQGRLDHDLSPRETAEIRNIRVLK